MSTVESTISSSILTPASGYLWAYSHTLNPYAGCAFGSGGCGVYCYVAESPLGLFAGKPWGSWVKAKVNAAELLSRELGRLNSPGQARIYMSSATDPYQPAEREWRITRSLLEVMQQQTPGLLVIQTRSPLVRRDFDLIATLPNAWLSMTVETDDDEVRRSLTPTCPSIDQRLAVMRQAKQQGIRVQAAVSPALPHDQHRFLGLLSECADRVVVDSFGGDGAGGKRSRRRPVATRFEELGWGTISDEVAAETLYEAARLRFGETNTGWGIEGFNQLATAVTDIKTQGIPAPR